MQQAVFLVLLCASASLYPSWKPAAELPELERSQEYRTKVSNAIATGQIESALKWYHQIPLYSDKEEVLGQIFSQTNPAQFTKEQMADLMDIIANFKTTRAFPGNLIGIILLDLPQWQQVLNPQPVVEKKPEKPVVPLDSERDTKHEKDTKAKAALPAPKRPAPGLHKSIILFPKHGEGIAVPRSLAIDPRVSEFLHTTFANMEPGESSIRLGFQPELLKKMVELMQSTEGIIRRMDPSSLHNQTSAEIDKRITDELASAIDIPEEQYVELIDAAAYLGSSIILNAIIARYIGTCVNGIRHVCHSRKELVALDMSPQIKRVIAQQYYLRKGQSIEEELGIKGIVPIPFDELLAYGQITQNYISQHPELLSDKNAQNKGYKDRKDALQQLFVESIKKRLWGVFDPMLRLRELDKNAPKDHPPLHVAATHRIDRENNVEYRDMVPQAGMVRRLLEAGANPNTYDDYGETPLLASLNRNIDDTEIPEILLKAGANPNLTRELSYLYSADERPTPLMLALGHGAMVNVKQLIKWGASVEAAVQRLKALEATHLRLGLPGNVTPVHPGSSIPITHAFRTLERNRAAIDNCVYNQRPTYRAAAEILTSQVNGTLE